MQNWSSGYQNETAGIANLTVAYTNSQTFIVQSRLSHIRDH